MANPFKRGADPYADAEQVKGRLVTTLQFFFNQTDLLAPTNQEMVSPVKGRIRAIRTTVQAAVTTGGAITAAVDGTTLDGFSITVADAATAGTRAVGRPTAGHATAAVNEGSRIAIIAAAAFATAGAVNGVVEIEHDV